MGRDVRSGQKGRALLRGQIYISAGSHEVKGCGWILHNQLTKALSGMIHIRHTAMPTTFQRLSRSLRTQVYNVILSSVVGASPEVSVSLTFSTDTTS